MQNEDVAYPGKESTPESVEDVLAGIADRNAGSDLGRLAQLLLDAAKGDLEVTDTFTETHDTAGDTFTDEYTETVSDPNLAPDVPTPVPSPDTNPAAPGTTPGATSQEGPEA